MVAWLLKCKTAWMCNYLRWLCQTLLVKTLWRVQHRFLCLLVQLALTCPLCDLYKTYKDLRICCWCQNVLTRCAHVSSVPSEQTKSNLKVTSPEDVEHVSRRQASPNGTAPSKGDAKGSRTVPRRHTLGGARGSREILAMQPSDMDKKREAFLEHLKQKYPHHASAIMGHQERLREQVSRLTDVWLGHVVYLLCVCLDSHYQDDPVYTPVWSFYHRDNSKFLPNITVY